MQFFKILGKWPNIRQAEPSGNKEQNTWTAESLQTDWRGYNQHPDRAAHPIIIVSSLRAVDCEENHSLILTFCHKKELPVLEKFLS